MMNDAERLLEIHWRATDLAKQLEQRAELYRLLGAPEISEEFARLKRIEVEPILKLSGEATA